MKQQISNIYTSSKKQGFLVPSTATIVSTSESNKSPDMELVLDPKTSYQSLIGFGGSFTEAAGYNLSLLDKQSQKEIINAYFGKNGSGYTICRTHMQSCDFALGSYAYVEDRSDTKLSTFSIARDKIYLLPFIKLAQKLAVSPFTLIASPWSPPPFMKTNNSMSYGGKLRPEFAKMWADMIAKYILSYKKEGIDIWAITAQNEPEAKQTWDSCLFSAEEEADFIYEYLVPSLKAHKLQPNILAWDHNRDNLYKRAKITYAHKAAKYIWGMGFHWYEEISKGRPMHETVLQTHKKYPDKHLIMTEGCQELFDGKVKMGDWSIGERYARNIIGDLNAWCEAWIDWNMILDTNGGPNHVMNLCDAPIKINPDTKEIIYANSYYYISHFSKYIRPGAKRIKQTLRVKNSADKETIMATVWTQPNQASNKKTLVQAQQTCAVLLNTNARGKTVSIRYKNNSIDTLLPPNSIQTILIEE